MTRPFRFYVRVRYQDCDAQHVVFNARYGDYVDLAITEFLRTAMPDRAETDGAFEVQVVRQLIEWKGPALYNDVIEIEVEPVRFGKTSFTIGFKLCRPGEAPIVTAECVYVAIHKPTWTKRPVTPEETRLLVEGAAGRIVDHAGYHPITLG